MWFVFALFSAVFAGLQSFMGKVSAEKGCDPYYISTLASVVTCVAGIVLYFAVGAPGAVIPAALYWLAIISGILYVGRTITQLESLRFIHAALFFPLYKVIGPALVTFIGVVFLKDAVSGPALIGIILSCLVPLLLITRDEHARQKNLPLGLMLMLASTAIAAVTAAVNAYAVEPSASYAIPFLTITYGVSIFVSGGLYVRKHGTEDLRFKVKAHASRAALWVGLGIGVFQFISFYLLLLAFAGGNLSIPYSINAHYILIPVILSVWLYKEHWNTQKAIALIVSLLALVLLHN